MAFKLKFWLFFFTQCAIYQSTAQIGRTSTWIFGQGIGIKFLGKTIDTFSVKQGYDFAYEGCGIYNNNSGDVVYHSDNSSLFNSNHNFILPNYNLGGAASSSQASLLTSINDSILHCFGTNPILGIYGGYTYNEYDMINNKWLTLNKIINYPISEAQAHVNHQNGRWQWVVSHSRLGDTLYSYLITDDGLETCPVISHAGPFYNDWYPGQGILKFSPDGKYLVLTTWSAEKVVISEFNNQTGKIQERTSIPDLVPYGAEFMESKLFVSSTRLGKIHEFDISKLDSLSIQKSKRVVYDTIDDVALGQIQRAPDGKMYVAYFGGNRLGVLSKISGNWQHSYSSFNFGSKQSYAGFPNFNASYFYTPSINFSYTRNCETNTFQFKANDTFGANNWQWQFTKGNILQTQSGKLITHTFTDTGNWQVRCIATNGNRNDTVIKNITILNPMKSEYLGEDILLPLGANVSGSIAGPNGMHCNHWQKLGDTAEKLGNTYMYHDTGTYVCKATNTVFCNYIDTIKVRVCDSFANAAIIERNGDSLFTKTYAAKYQWYIHDIAIKNATKPSLKLAQAGQYTLRTWNASYCDSISKTFDVQNLGTQKFKTQAIRIFPNPNNGSFEIQSTDMPIQSVLLYDVTGNKVFEKQGCQSKNVEINLNLTSGIYLITINGKNHSKLSIY